LISKCYNCAQDAQIDRCCGCCCSCWHCRCWSSGSSRCCR